MTVQQAVQVYLEQLKASGYSYPDRARKARILNRSSSAFLRPNNR